MHIQSQKKQLIIFGYSGHLPQYRLSRYLVIFAGLVGSHLLISMLEKFNLLNSIVRTTLLLLMWKWNMERPGVMSELNCDL